MPLFSLKTSAPGAFRGAIPSNAIRIEQYLEVIACAFVCQTSQSVSRHVSTFELMLVNRLKYSC